jgi:SAM-dependent methyltransferase
LRPAAVYVTVLDTMEFVQESKDYERAGQQKDQYTADEVIEVSCPLCGGANREKLYTEHGVVGIVRCLDCALIYVSPRIKAPEQVYWGPMDKYVTEARQIFAGKLPHHRDPNYVEELELIRRYKPFGRFLDVGCNMGFLLNKAHKMGWQTVGVEPSPSLSKIAREKWGLNVHNCFLHEVPVSENHAFDVVAFSDVFEHITEPIAFLEQARRLLKPDGILYVKVPNGQWNVFKQQMLQLLGKRPSQGIWDSYEHVVHYSDKTLTRMLERGGFAIKQVTIGKPIQTPVWHNYVGHYFQYPTPWILDWRHQFGRSAFYWASRIERALLRGSIGRFAPNIAAIAALLP